MKSIEVIQKVQILDEMVGELVGSNYGHASDVAHTSKTKKEVTKLLAILKGLLMINWIYKIISKDGLSQ